MSARPTSITLRELRARTMRELLTGAPPMRREQLVRYRDLRLWPETQIGVAIGDLILAGHLAVDDDGVMRLVEAGREAA